jgi:hypothetical protein
MNISWILKSTLLCCFVSPSYAATISYMDLPQALRTEVENKGRNEMFYMDDLDLGMFSNMSAESKKFPFINSIVDSPILSVFNLKHLSDGGREQTNKLLRYTRYAPSKETYESYNFNSGSIETKEVSLPKYFWVAAPTEVSSQGENIVKLMHSESEYNNSYSFNLGYDAMKNGSGVYTSTYDPDTSIVQTGNMANIGQNYCIECGVDVILNLVGFNYDNGDFAVSQYDSRALLFGSSSEYPRQTSITNLFVQPSPVPLPASLWFFGSSILALGWRFKFRK